MLKELINRVRGQVWLRVTCPYPERVLNLCSARKLAFWDLEWGEAETFTCRMSRRDHRVLSRAAEKLDCTIEIVRREGAPYTLAKLRHRQALAVGIAACGTAVLIGSFFVWDIQIAGNETVPQEVILRSLEKNGVHRGCFGFALNGEDIRNHVLLELEDVVWLAVNVRGCVARVRLVLRVQALGGVPQVLKGMSVTEGQLLISGVEDTGTFGTRFTAGLGSVEGRTWYTLTANVPLTGAEKRYTGREKRLRSVIFGSRRIKFFANSSIDSGQCDKITERTPVRVCGIPLPITWETETLRFYETEPVTVTQARRQKETGAALEAYLHSLVDPYGEVTASQVASRLRGDVLTVTLTAECREELGTQAPIYTANEPAGASGSL